ncbi:MAG: TIGR03067 domain-containing protein [Isosphaeraceae bacterium]
MALTNPAYVRTFRGGLAILQALAICASFGLAGGAAIALADDDKPKAEALKALKGTWVAAEDEGIDSKWTFEGETLKASVNGIDYTCKIKIDPVAKPHATVDFLIDEGPEEAKGQTARCVYKLDGEKLTLCVSLPGKDRPKEFEQAEGESFLFKLKKEKTAEKKEEKKKD